MSAKRRRLRAHDDYEINLIPGYKLKKRKNDFAGLPWGGILVALAIGIVVFSGAAAAKVVMNWKTRDEFIRMIDAVMQQLGISQETRLLIIAQAGVETGMGTAGEAVQGNNFWNISAGSSWKGATIAGGDKEPDGKGGWKPITQQWRAWPSVADGVRGYLEFLGLPRYAVAKKALLDGDAVQFVQALYDAGYYTWPVDNFTDSTGFHYGYWAMFSGQLAKAKKVLGVA